MELQLINSGSIAGFIHKYPILNVNELSVNDQIKLSILIKSSNFYNLPVDIGMKGFDLIYTTLIIRDSNKYHSVRANFLDNDLKIRKFKELTDYVESLYKKYKYTVQDQKTIISYPWGSNFIKWLSHKLKNLNVPLKNIETDGDYYQIIIGNKNIILDWKHLVDDEIEEFSKALNNFGYKITYKNIDDPGGYEVALVKIN